MKRAMPTTGKNNLAPHALALIAALALGVAGCGSKSKYVPVSGTVTLDGHPVPGAGVSFQPAGGAKDPGPGSIGICDDAGHYVLATVRKDPGAVPGIHAVKIHGPTGAATTNANDVTTVAKDKFPAKYNDRSELSFQVPPEGTDKADFNLTSK
jgi:hypothetical protein